MEPETSHSVGPNPQILSSTTQDMPSVAETETGADVDEPPDFRRPLRTSQEFQRTAVRKPNCHSSLLTKALQYPSDDDEEFHTHLAMLGRLRRRSMTSNISLASTADLTSDTGLTSPSRTNTPSPPLPEIRTLQLHDVNPQKVPTQESRTLRTTPVAEAAPRRRCITFACAAKPNAKPAEPAQVFRPILMPKAPSAEETPRRTCIKFACPAPHPASTQNTPPHQPAFSVATPEKVTRSPRECGASPARKFRSPRQLSRRVLKDNKSSRTVAVDSAELEDDSAQFHEFASEKMREDDWVRHERKDTTTVKRKITINDTLTKENHFRQIAKEAEEEAEAEEDDAAVENEDEDDVESDDGEEDEDDDETEYASDDGDDGYRTDEETGFAESDDEGDSELELWTPSQNCDAQRNFVSSSSRRSSIGENHSDSSTGGPPIRHGKTRRVPIRSLTPELPDSTDFVCGTLDEDRPMEEAYLSCLAARKASKHHVIPQDIDPSFPASDPEDDAAEEMFNPVHQDSDENVWVHGEMEDLDHEQDRNGRKKTKTMYSPKRLHSPPPKTKGRCRSPRPGQTSPRRMRSPAPKVLTSSRGSPAHAGPVLGFAGLGTRVGLTQTKSLPRPPAMFPHAKHGKKPKAAPRHVRGAIDIVKGLESKRLRRKEKFFQKYCNRARKGQVYERKPLPGHGAERMKALGLLMAGKSNTKENYVISV